ncbi:tetratricopeptide repeat protein [Nakamurella sp. YIM 132087]|uniref:Tetratricopeptide repeat protein n=1 Tax=Nakamurella alba TaxID=2665158 RepID=A0A7K1FPU8_9ACTN|nr:tetratricopeptide repeat protein [Nakamurella alba]MTD16090.1 tetratricopeptide repeat protein [Nakamurella alba]
MTADHGDRVDGADLDAWWDFDDPAASADRFRQALAVLPADRPVIAAELTTQLARALGLAGDGAGASALLDQVDTSTPVVQARVALERGRLLRSGGAPEAAVPFFRTALDAAGSAGEEYLTVDALHMLAIVLPDEADELTGQALIVTSRSADPRVRRWAGALRNNLGWSHHDAGDHQGALRQFEGALEVYLEHGTAEQVHIAHWSVARALRSLGRHDEALAIQSRLSQDDAPDGYVEEELAELYEALGRPDEATHHRHRAQHLLPPS